MSPSRLFILFLSFALSVSALTSPHIARSAHHRALAGRVAVPVAANPSVPQIRRRQNSKRCKPRSSSAQPANKPETSNDAQTPAVPTTHPVFVPKPTTHAQVTTKRLATTHYQPPPAPTPKPPPPPPAPKPASNLPSFMVGVQTGQGTFYATGLGACGITNKDTDFIAAASHLLFDQFPGYTGGNPNKNPLCGRKVTATYQGKSVTVAITDRCAACAVTDLDFSPSAFSRLADFSVGRLDGVKWTWD